ncbi:MAG: hypothetical protein ACOYWZ_13285 [Bacillota bacterium]
MKIKTVLTIGIFIGLIGFGWPEDKNISQQIESLKQQVEELQQQIKSLKQQVRKLQQQNDSLKQELEELQQETEANTEALFRFGKDIAILERYEYVYFDPSSLDKFNSIDTDCGRFFISLADVQPFLDGYKLIFKIGNPYSIEYGRFTFKIKWGRSSPDPFPAKIYEEWNNSLREKEESFVSRLKPGFWNKIEVILPNTKADEMGYLKISEMHIETISLYDPPE